jgi:hypothetical protein
MGENVLPPWTPPKKGEMSTKRKKKARKIEKKREKRRRKFN